MLIPRNFFSRCERCTFGECIFGDIFAIYSELVELSTSALAIGRERNLAGLHLQAGNVCDLRLPEYKSGADLSLENNLGFTLRRRYRENGYRTLDDRDGADVSLEQDLRHIY